MMNLALKFPSFTRKRNFFTADIHANSVADTTPKFKYELSPSSPGNITILSSLIQNINSLHHHLHLKALTTLFSSPTYPKITEMEISDTEVNNKSEISENSEQSQFPHEAMFLVLTYLPLFELLAMSEVCRSLRDALNSDILPWLNVTVKRPLSFRLSNDILMKITYKANGNLSTLALINCSKITDDCLQAVVANNPQINKLHIPGCTGLTPEGVIKAVKYLTENSNNFTSLKINGIPNLQKEHLETLISLIQSNQTWKSQPEGTACSIDVDICPQCSEVRQVFDCPGKTCKRKAEKRLSSCRGCGICVPRCEECGTCVEFEEQGEAACSDLLCIECWLRLPKCSFCNKPYCKQHAYQQNRLSGSSGFLCDVCHSKFT